MELSADKGASAETAQGAVAEIETGIGTVEYVEYVSDEDWDVMLHVYRIIMDNYETAQGLVDAGQSDPSGILEKAGELIEYGKGCGRDGLTAEEAGEKLREMVDTADGMLNLIERGGGTVVGIPAAEEGTDVDAGSPCTERTGAATEGAGDAGSPDGRVRNLRGQKLPTGDIFLEGEAGTAPPQNGGAAIPALSYDWNKGREIHIFD